MNDFDDHEDGEIGEDGNETEVEQVEVRLWLLLQHLPNWFSKMF